MSKPTQSTPSDSTKYLTAAAAGVVFGFALEKGHVFSPETIVRQFLMQDFTMLKMFLSAAATSMFVHSALSCTRSGAVPVDLLLNRKSDRGVLTTALGAAILGSGMALAGSCPGTVWVQLGAGESNALLVFFSGLLGATCYAFADRLGLFRGISTAMVPKEDKVNKTLGVSYAASATVVASALIALIAFFEYAFPSHLPLLPHSLADVKWSPITAGIIVGCLQLPMLLFAHRAIGASSSFIAVSANAIAAVAPDVVKNTKALADAKDGASNWLQPVYVSAAALGSYLAARLSNTVGVPSGLSLSHTSAALGGFLLLFGARVANGCTSGHGISGFSLLGLRSISATAAMFGGAIATAVVLRALHQYPAGF